MTTWNSKERSVKMFIAFELLLIVVVSALISLMMVKYFSSDAPRLGVMDINSTKSNVSFELLLERHEVPWGLYKMTVDDHTFLLYSDMHGAAIVEYKPIEKKENADD